MDSGTHVTTKLDESRTDPRQVHALAGASCTAAAWCVLVPAPIFESTARAATATGCMLAAALLCAQHATLRSRALATAILIAVCGTLLGSPVLVVAVGLLALWWTGRAEPTWSSSTWLFGAELALLVGSLRTSVEPGSLDAGLEPLFELIVPDSWVVNEVTGSVYGASAALVLLGACWALPASWMFRGATFVVGLGCIAAGRVLESGWPALLAITVLPLLVRGFAPAAATPTATRGSRWIARASVSIVAVLACMSAVPTTGTATQPVIGIVGAWHGTMERESPPGAPRTPTDELPHFHSFAERLRRGGFEVRVIDSPSDPKLAECTALLTINFSGTTAFEFVAPVRAAVERGARLLVLADHTDLFGQIEPTNALLAGTGIEIVFDSAVPEGLGPSWIGALEGGRDPLFGAHPNGEGIHWSVGASLNTRSPARVLAYATRATSDAGIRAKPGGLGNLTRDAIEPLGGFAIAADAVLGAGRVLVFGDTAVLQDGPVDIAPDFPARVADWLSGVEPRWRSIATRNVGFVGGGMLAVTACATTVGAPWRAFVVAAADVAAGWLRRRAESEHPRSVPRVDLNLAFLPMIEISRARDRDVEPLLDALGRQGWFVQAARDREGRRAGDIRVWIDPQRALDATAVNEVHDELARGVDQWFFVSPVGARNLRLLFDEFGIELGSPRGPAVESEWDGPLRDTAGAPKFRSCFAIEIDRTGEPADQPEFEVVARAFGSPVVLLGRVGAGRVLVVADSTFLFDRSIDPVRGGTVETATTLSAVIAAALAG